MNKKLKPKDDVNSSRMMKEQLSEEERNGKAAIETEKESVFQIFGRSGKDRRPKRTIENVSSR